MPSETSFGFNPVLHMPALNVMNILNEVIQEYPQAISFASGRPVEEAFAIHHWIGQTEGYVSWRAQQLGTDPATVWRQLCQYGATNGIINDLVAKALALDENVVLDPSDVMITSGCQEAMSICLDGLFDVNHALAVTDPTYVGITGLAAVRHIPVHPIDMDAEGPELGSLARAQDSAKAAGRTLRAFYLIPDFDNPTGASMSLARREALLAYCESEGILVIEDNPYGMLRYEGARLPTLLALDRRGIVLHLGTFSKTICPGLRVGYLATRALAGGEPLLRLLSKIKSLTTVNTGQYVQAIVGGILLEHGCSLRPLVDPLLACYRRQRDAMLEAFERYLAPLVAEGIALQWNRPDGGFFITLRTASPFGLEEMHRCAAEYGVICIPMSFFALTPERYECDVRLSFSYVSESSIDEGVRRLARYLCDHAARKPVTVMGACYADA